MKHGYVSRSLKYSSLVPFTEQQDIQFESQNLKNYSLNMKSAELTTPSIKSKDFGKLKLNYLFQISP